MTRTLARAALRAGTVLCGLVALVLLSPIVLAVQMAEVVEWMQKKGGDE